MMSYFSFSHRFGRRLSPPSAGLLALSLGLCLPLLPSCRKSEIRTYIAPKDVPYEVPVPGAGNGHGHAAPSTPPDAPPPPAAEAPPAISYTAPDTWQKVAGSPRSSGQFFASTPAGEVGIGIIALQSMQGQENLLIGMWRGSVGLPEGTEEEAAKSLTPVEVGGLPAQMFEVEGTMQGEGSRKGQPTAILTAFVHRDGRSWFFKVDGPPKAVKSQKPAFLEFLKTVKF